MSWLIAVVGAVFALLFGSGGVLLYRSWQKSYRGTAPTRAGHAIAFAIGAAISPLTIIIGHLGNLPFNLYIAALIGAVMGTPYWLYYRSSRKE